MEETSIFRACKEELKHFLGEDGLAELEAYEKEYLDSNDSKEVA